MKSKEITIDPLSKNPYPESDLFKFFVETMGYEYSWDYDSKHTWFEFIDPDTNKLAIQIEMGIPLAMFIEIWESDKPLTVFIAGDPDSEEWKNIETNINKVNKK